MNSDRNRGEPIAIRLVIVAGMVFMFLGLPRWTWLTDLWYPAEWSPGWLGLAGIALTSIGLVLHLRYREPPFGRS